MIADAPAPVSPYEVDPLPFGTKAVFDAIALVERVSTSDLLTSYGLKWLKGAHAYLYHALDLEFRGSRPEMSTEQQAKALLKTLAEDLKRAGVELEKAAFALKNASKGMDANHAHLAAQAALTTAEEWLT